MWDVITRCGSQVRIASFGGPGGTVSRPVGLDYGAVLALAGALGADVDLLAAVLPDVEAAVLAGGDEGGIDEV